MPPVPDPDQEQEWSNMTPSYVSTMMEAITKGVEAALHNAMVNGIPFASPNSKCTHSGGRLKMKKYRMRNQQNQESIMILYW
jgi:hypothetical protein